MLKTVLSVACSAQPSYVPCTDTAVADRGGNNGTDWKTPSGPTSSLVTFGVLPTAAAVNGIEAPAFGTESCNIGDEELWWQRYEPKPTIGQNVYRIKDGRFEQLGQGWLKHGFFASNDWCDAVRHGR